MTAAAIGRIIRRGRLQSTMKRNESDLVVVFSIVYRSRVNSPSSIPSFSVGISITDL